MKNTNALAKWSWDENKQFEVALAELLSQDDAQSPDFFHRIAMRVAGKSAGEIREHYRALEEDVERIEAGDVPLPEYADDDEGMEAVAAEKKAARVPRKAAVPWTAEEHELFLKGLKKYGKGDWRSISRNCVITRTPTQVASHAQKYFNGLMKSKSKGSANSRPGKHRIKSKYST